VLQSGVELGYRASRSTIAEALDLLVHIDRRNGRRFIRQVLKVSGYDTALDQFRLETAYEQS
jgi:hypothetical protein